MNGAVFFWLAVASVVAAFLLLAVLVVRDIDKWREAGRGQAGGSEPDASVDLPCPVSPYDWANEEVA